LNLLRAADGISTPAFGAFVDCNGTRSVL
jgi:hypothetical protein